MTTYHEKGFDHRKTVEFKKTKIKKTFPKKIPPKKNTREGKINV